MTNLKKALLSVSKKAECIKDIHSITAQSMGISAPYLYQLRSGTNPQVNNHPTKKENIYLMKKVIDTYKSLIKKHITELQNV